MKTQSLNIGKLIYDQCKDICSGGCYPCVADKGTVYPFMTYRRTGLTEGSDKDRDYVDRVNVEITVASTNYDESVSLIQNVKDTLDHHRFRYNSMCVERTEVVGCMEYWSNDAYVQKLNFVFYVTAW